MVKTGLPLRQVLQKPDLAGRMISWSIEFSEHDIKYEKRGPIKAQVLADFMVELSPAPTEHDECSGFQWWMGRQVPREVEQG